MKDKIILEPRTKRDYTPDPKKVYDFVIILNVVKTFAVVLCSMFYPVYVLFFLLCGHVWLISDIFTILFIRY